MGISVQAAGIGVQVDKFYLVNLNADPAMNELLVCYLKVCVGGGARISCAPLRFVAVQARGVGGWGRGRGSCIECSLRSVQG